MTLRICILETDVLRPELAELYQGYGRMFERLFDGQPIPADFEIFNVVQGHYPVAGSHYDAYLVTGSKHDSFGSEPWIQALKIFLLERYQAGDKLLGICFGHQLLALLLGGETRRAEQGWGLGTHQYQLHDQPGWMTPALDELTMLIIHQDQVTRLPEHATLLASSSFCPHAAYYIGDQVLCFQGHPEFVADYSRAILDIRHDYFDAPLRERALLSLEQGHQGRQVGEWMLRFVAAGRRQQAVA